MSYILEALRKSEQERARGETPDVRTQHELAPLQATPSRRGQRVAWLLGGALCLNALLLGVWLFSDRQAGRAPSAPAAPTGEPTAEPPTPRVPAASPAEARTAGPTEVPAGMPPGGGATSRPERAAPVPAPVAPQQASAPPSTAARAAAEDVEPAAVVRAEPGTGTPPRAAAETRADEPTGPAPSAPDPVAIRDLPDRIQRRIPTLEFATHIFGDAPRYREVTINGRRYAEGERVEGMLLSEITETGVVFDYEGYRFEVSVLEDWDY